MFQVEKKDGSLVDFDQTKIINGILMSGASQEDAQKIADDIQAWLPTAVTNGMIKSLDLRSKVIEELKTINPTAAMDFESYKKNTN